MLTDKPSISDDALPGLFASAFEYLVDTGQRSVLFLDVMRRRGEQYREHMEETVPHLLSYEIELIADGRTLKRPVNYGLCASSRRLAWRSTSPGAPLWWSILALASHLAGP
jgi:hypothetical protein